MDWPLRIKFAALLLVVSLLPLVSTTVIDAAESPREKTLFVVGMSLVAALAWALFTAVTLGPIEAQGGALQQARDDLEQRVQERTAD